MTLEVKLVKDVISRDTSLARSFPKGGFTMLNFVAFFIHLEVPRHLIDNGASVDAIAKNRMMVTSIHSATANSQVEIAEFLLLRSANANARRQNGFTALHAAAQNESIEMAKLLLKYDASLTEKRDDGKSPFEMTKEGDRGWPKKEKGTGR